MPRGANSGRKVYAIDCETDPFLIDRVPVPFLWDAYDIDHDKHFMFEHTSDIKHFLENQKCIAYAHNGGRFDFLMPGFLKGLELGHSPKIINGRLAKFKIGECEYRDSMCIYPEGLSTFCKLEIDYKKLEKKVRKQHMLEIIKYLKVDTESLGKLVKYFRETYGDHLTIAGAAMALWENMSKTDISNHDAAFFEENKPFYYGGRVQCFHGGIINEPFIALDINSAYPFAMLDKHPYSVESDTVDGRDIKPGDRVIPQSLYCIRGRARGSLPFLQNGSIAFPDDDTPRQFNITGWELQAGLDTHSLNITRIEFRRDFRELLDFSRYIHHFYELKKSAAALYGKKSAQYLFAKRMMNALSGKYGAHPDEYLNYTLVNPDYRANLLACKFCRGDGCAACGDSGDDAAYVDCGMVGDHWLCGEPLQEMQKTFYNIATVASITGHTRALLWRHAHAATAAGRRLLYCDTDCLVISGNEPPGHFSIGNELGQWSADKVYDRGGIAGKKLYAFHELASGEWKVACKGSKLTAAQVMRVARGRTVLWEKESPTMRVGSQPRFIKRRIRPTIGVSRKTGTVKG